MEPVLAVFQMTLPRLFKRGRSVVTDPSGPEWTLPAKETYTSSDRLDGRLNRNYPQRDNRSLQRPSYH